MKNVNLCCNLCVWISEMFVSTRIWSECRALKTVVSVCRSGSECALRLWAAGRAAKFGCLILISNNAIVSSSVELCCSCGLFGLSEISSKSRLCLCQCHCGFPWRWQNCEWRETPLSWESHEAVAETQKGAGERCLVRVFLWRGDALDDNGRSVKEPLWEGILIETELCKICLCRTNFDTRWRTCRCGQPFLTYSGQTDFWWTRKVTQSCTLWWLQAHAE